MQKSNDPYYDQQLQKYKRDLAIMFKEIFSIELNKRIVCKKSFHVSFGTKPYP
jgi:hypothetical protein